MADESVYTREHTLDAATAAKILRDYNHWRRDDEWELFHSPRAVGLAIEAAIRALEFTLDDHR